MAAAQDRVDARWLVIVDREVAHAIHRAPPWSDRDDIRGDALYGLADALAHESPERGEFAAYLTLRVRGAIIDGYRRRLLSRSAQRCHAWVSPHPPDVVAQLADRPHDPLDAVEAGLLVGWLLRFCTDRERAVIVRHDFAGEKLDVIAADYGLTGARVSQIRTCALRRMRQLARSA